MTEECVNKGASCPVSVYQILETFDNIDLFKICEFLSNNNGPTSKVVQGWYAADLDINKRGQARLCLDVDPNVSNPNDPSAVFLYKGPREKDAPYTVALGKVKKVEFIKVEGKDQGSHVCVEIEDSAGTILHFTEKQFEIFSPAYPRSE